MYVKLQHVDSFQNDAYIISVPLMKQECKFRNMKISNYL